MDEHSIFAKALECESEQARIAFLSEACGEDEALRERVARLVKLHEGASDFLEKPVLPAQAGEVSEGPGSKIGDYKLLEQIGEGGMGVVYMAAQQEPVKRQVAVKIIKPGMDSKQVIARFEAERQALALMEHENIARVLDAGTTDSGRPYFVMELVRGIPVTDYCRHERLEPEQRLQLFQDICRAVQHAHHKGIIHRDIKPSNVMVTLHDGEPVVKMIDFGVAKATNQQLTNRTFFTNYAQMIGTPMYMSPEQAEMSGLDVDTRSDIYSLGVLLYELLTDTTPFEKQRLKEVSYDEMRRIICEEEPPKPSTRMSTIGAAHETISDQRRADARRMSQALRGELDWIVIKALEKNRVRRYQTAKDFAEDVQRFLDGEPVEACPPSVAYRTGKLLRKYRGIAAATGTISLLLVVGAVVAATLAVRATRAERDAERLQVLAEEEAATATAISDFLRQELLGQASPYENPNRDLRLRQVLDRASERIEGHFDGPPVVEAEIRVTLATTYYHLAEYQESAKHFEQAYQICVAELGEQHPKTLRIASQRAFYSRRRKASTSMLKDILKQQEATLPANHPDALRTMSRLAVRYTWRSQFDNAQPLFDRVIPAMKRVLGAEHPDTLACLDSLARLYAYEQRHDESEQLHQQILKSRRQVLGKDHPQYHDSLAALADLKMIAGRTEEALDLYDQVVELRRRVQGDSHPSTLADERVATKALRNADRLEAATTRASESLTSHRRRFGDYDPRTRHMIDLLATLYETQGHFEEALPLCIDILDWRRQSRGNNHAMTIAAARRAARVYMELGRFDEVETLHQEMVDTQTRLYGWDDIRTVRSLLALAYGYRRAERFEEAEKILKDIAERRREAFGDDDPQTLLGVMQLGYVYEGWQKHTRAEEQFRTAWTTGQRAWGSEHRNTLEAGSELATSLRHLNRLEEAETLCREVLATKQRVFGEGHEIVADSLHELSTICRLQDRLDEADELLERVIISRLETPRGNYRRLLETIEQLNDLAPRYERQNNPQAARSIRDRVANHSLDLLTLQRERFGSDDKRTLVVLRRTAGYLISQSRFEEAVKHRRELFETQTRLHGPDDQRTLNASRELAYCLQKLRRFDEAVELQQDNVERQTRLSGEHDVQTLQQMMQLAFIYKQDRQLARAEDLFREVWQAGLDVLGADDAETLRAGNQLSAILGRQGHYGKSESLCREVLATRSRVLGEDHPDTLHSLTTLAELCRKTNQLDEARELLDQLIQVRRQTLGDRHNETLDAIEQLDKLPFLYRQRDDLKSAISTRAQVYDLSRDIFGETSLKTTRALGLLVGDYERSEEWQKMYDASVELFELRSSRNARENPPFHAILWQTKALTNLDRREEANELILKCVALWNQAGPDNHKPFASHAAGTVTINGQQAVVLIARGEHEQAEAILLQCYDLSTSSEQLPIQMRRKLVRQLIDLYNAWDKPDEAAKWHDELGAIN